MKNFPSQLKRIKKKIQTEEQGMIVVEATISFMVFLMVVIAIIYLTNIFIVHNKVQFAINSTAHQLSGYSYLYQTLGVRKAEQRVRADGSKYTKPIDETAGQVIDTMNKIQTFWSDANTTAEMFQDIEVSGENLSSIYGQADKTLQSGTSTVESTKKTVEDVASLCKDPKSLLTGMIYMGASAGSYAIKSAGATAAADALTGNYIEGSGMNADAWLRAHGVVNGYEGLHFSGSTMFCDTEKRMIDIVVSYDIELKFISFILPEDTIHVIQRVSVPAWLDGDGVTYIP